MTEYTITKHYLKYGKEDLEEMGYIFTVIKDMCKYKKFTFCRDSHCEGYYFCEELGGHNYECTLENCPYFILKE